MDRVQTFAGAIPLDTDILRTNQYAMMGICRLAEAFLGRDNIWVTGLEATADGVTAFHVNIAPGQIYQQSAIEPTVYGGALPVNPATVLKQGFLDTTTNFSCPKPSAGNSIYYLFSAAYVEQDTDPQVLLYYNAANPSQAFNGPLGNGAQQNTTRAGRLSLIMTTGTAATSGSETVPATPPGYTALWTVRVSSGTVSITNASSATTDGIWKVGTSHFIQFGGVGDLTQATADTRYARLAFANTFTETQTINKNDVIALNIGGSSNAGGSGIKVTGDGATTPSKRLRVRGGAFGIMNDAASTDILVLSDAGNLTVTGTMTAGGKITAGAVATNALDVVTLAFADARYAAAGASGFITQATADTRYVRLGETANQTLVGQLIVPAQPTSGTVPANQLVTQGYVDSHYASLAGSGITKTQADSFYLSLAFGTPQTVTTTVTFSAAVTISTNPSSSQHAVTLGFADTRYARKDQAETFTSTVAGQPPTADGHFVTRGHGDARYARIEGSVNVTFASTVTFSNPVTVAPATSDTHAVTRGQMNTAIGMGTGITQVQGDARYGQLNASNNWSQSNTFSQAITQQTNASSNQHLITKGQADSLYAGLNGPTFTAAAGGPDAASGNRYVTYQQVFGAGGFAKLVANTFTATQTINPTAGDCIILGAAPSGFTGITCPGAKQFGILNSSGNWNYQVSGVSKFTINSTTGTISCMGSAVIDGTVTANGAGQHSFSGPVVVGTPTAGSHAVRQDQFIHVGNSNSGHLDLPNGYILNFGRNSGGTISFHKPFTTTVLASSCNPYGFAVAQTGHSVTNANITIATNPGSVQCAWWVLGK